MASRRPTALPEKPSSRPPNKAARVEPVAVGAAYRAVVWAAVFVSVVALVASLTLVSVSTNDVWIQMETGQSILKTWTIPQHDDFSFVTGGRDYVAHEWLSGVVFALAYRALGVPGLIFLKFVVVLASVACLLSICRLHRDRLSVILPIFGIMGYIAAARFLERPHLFTYLFSATVLLCLFQYRDGGQRRGWLLAVLPIQVVWANLHGGFIQGLLLIGAFAFGEALSFLRARMVDVRSTTASWRYVLPLLALPLVALAVTTINPYGFRLVVFPFQLTGMDVFMSRVFEWWPAFHDGFDRTFVFYGYWLWVALLFGGIWLTPGAASLSTRRTGDGTFWPRMGLWAAYVVFVYGFGLQQGLLSDAWWVWGGIVTLFCVVHWREVDFAEVALVLLVFGLSMRHNRAIADAVIVTFPILTRRLTWALERLERLRHRVVVAESRLGGAWPATVLLASFLVVGEAIHVYAWGYWYDPTSAREGGFGIADTMPLCAVDYIAQNDISGNAYTSYTAAGLLLYRRYPEVRVSMDSRNEVYGAELFEEYEEAHRSPEAMAAYLTKYPVDFFLVNHSDLTPAVSKALLESNDWVQVFVDHKQVVLVRNRPQFADIIRRDAYRKILPTLQGGFRFEREHAADYMVEVERAAAQCPASWLSDWYRAQAQLALGQTEKAIGAARTVIDRNPQAWFAWMLLGNAYAGLGDRAQAIDAYDRVLAINPAYEGAREKRQALQSRRP